MADQILWINVLVAIVPGALLLLTPKSLIKMLGLPQTEQAFYPRLLGVFLISFATAIVVEGNGASGLGITGVATFNLVNGSALAALLMIGGLVMAKRGRWVLRGVTAMMLLLGILGLAAS